MEKVLLSVLIKGASMVSSENERGQTMTGGDPFTLKRQACLKWVLPYTGFGCGGAGRRQFIIDARGFAGNMPGLGFLKIEIESEIIMAVKVAINGFGRIGRLVFRAIAEQGLLEKDVQVVAVGDIVPADNLAYLLKYDSTQGRFHGSVSSKKSAPDKTEDDVLIVNGQEIHVVSAKDPSGLPWKQLGAEIVIESTGLFTEAEKAKGHLVA